VVFFVIVGATAGCGSPGRASGTATLNGSSVSLSQALWVGESTGSMVTFGAKSMGPGEQDSFTVSFVYPLASARVGTIDLTKATDASGAPLLVGSASSLRSGGLAFAQFESGTVTFTRIATQNNDWVSGSWEALTGVGKDVFGQPTTATLASGSFEGPIAFRN
jgi:hypothetical protein